MSYFGQRKLRLGELLVNGGAITGEQLADALDKQRNTKRKLGETLIDMNVVTEETIAETLSDQLGYAIIDLTNVTVSAEILSLITPAVLRKNRALPIEYAQNNMNILRVAMADPLDLDAMDDISIITGCQVEPLISTPRAVMVAIDRFFGSEDMDEALEEYTKEKLSKYEEDGEAEEVSNSPIVMLVNDLIEKAARKRASDIHIEALENAVRVRFRIDGALYEYKKYPSQLLPAIVARIKIIGGMDISEKRKPQDEEYVYTAQDVKNSFRGDFTVKREVKCKISEATLSGGAIKTTVDMEITFKTQADSVPYHRLSGVTATGNPGVADKTVTLSEPVIFDNSATGAPLERVYLYYYPAYSNYNATGYEISEDKIVIENNSGSEDINFYLVKQIEHTNRNLATSEATYTPVVSLSSAGTGNEVLFHNLNQDISGTGVPGGFTISGCTAKTFDELVEEKEEVLVYDLDIKVFKKSDSLTCVFELKGTR